MGGVGKTTLARQVAGQAKGTKLFDTVVMETVKQNAEISEIQQEIGDGLGLEFREKTILVRADRLRERLKKEERVLVILDDVWESLDLEAVGIPCVGDDLSCKVLLTSRDLNVLSMMDSKRNFAVGVLEEEEAWNLFNKMAGDRAVESPDLYSTATEIAKKCAGLSIAMEREANIEENEAINEIEFCQLRSLKLGHKVQEDTTGKWRISGSFVAVVHLQTPGIDTYKRHPKLDISGVFG
ncbi:probable disease resistance protein At1g61300 [Durio zibethinus]|uniref:Probable disease resistance protein At1g61300 n=1 Tax=Durio zibethinus TaxID=66656 RepID=A0A6P5WU40_DURZI|nr:probable disease resistance protein At1g61300 [Durio zibethinus]